MYYRRPYLPKIRFNIIFVSTVRYPNWSLTLRSWPNSVWISHFQFAPHVLTPHHHPHPINRPHSGKWIEVLWFILCSQKPATGLNLSQMKPVLTFEHYFFLVVIIPSTSRFPKWCLPCTLSYWNLSNASHLSCQWLKPLILSSLMGSRNIQWRVQIMKLLMGPSLLRPNKCTCSHSNLRFILCDDVLHVLPHRNRQSCSPVLVFRRWKYKILNSIIGGIPPRICSLFLCHCILIWYCKLS